MGYDIHPASITFPTKVTSTFICTFLICKGTDLCIYHLIIWKMRFDSPGLQVPTKTCLQYPSPSKIPYSPSWSLFPARNLLFTVCKNKISRRLNVPLPHSENCPCGPSTHILSMLGWEVCWRHDTMEQGHWIILTGREGQVLCRSEIPWGAAGTFSSLPIKVLINTETLLYSLHMQ